MPFHESQSLRNNYVYLLAGIPIAILLTVLFTTSMERWTYFILSFAILISCAVIFMVFSIRLNIDEMKNGIKVSVNYFFRQKIDLNWDEIDSITIKKISPIKNFGGWGVRYTLKTTGFIFSGRNAVFIKTKNGRSYAFTIVRTNEFYTMLTEKHGLHVVTENISLI